MDSMSADSLALTRVATSMGSFMSRTPSAGGAQSEAPLQWTARLRGALRARHRGMRFFKKISKLAGGRLDADQHALPDIVVI
jgi:hypothetical protein